MISCIFRSKRIPCLPPQADWNSRSREVTMANTLVRGHTLWYNPNYVQYFFVFSAVLKGRIQYYLFKERKTEEQIHEAEAAIMQAKE